MPSSFSQKLHQLIGNRIRNARTSLGINQGELAKRIALSRTSITNIEAGKQRLLLDHLFLLAGALGVEPVNLLPSRAELAETTELKEKADYKNLTKAQKGWVEKILAGK